MLVHCEESVVFWLLVTLFERYDVREVFVNNLAGMHVHLAKLDELIRLYLPDTAGVFEELGIVSSMFAANWIVSLFS